MAKINKAKLVWLLTALFVALQLVLFWSISVSDVPIQTFTRDLSTSTFDPYSSKDFTNTPISKKRPREHFTYSRSSSITPSISVIVPCYNCGKTIAETIYSIIYQSFQDFEIIVANDASTDPYTLEQLSKLPAIDDRILVVHQEINEGIGGARNAALQYAKADLIYPLDGDDLIEPTTLEKLFWHLIAFPQSSFANGYCLGFGNQRYLWSKGFEQGKLFLEENQVIYAALFRKQDLLDAGGYITDKNMLEDWDMWLNLASQGKWGTTVPEYLYWYRRRSPQETSWDTPANIQKNKYNLQQKYSTLYSSPDNFPVIKKVHYTKHHTLVPANLTFPASNILDKNAQGWIGKRVLMVVPWLRFGGADVFNLNLARYLVSVGVELSVATTAHHSNPWMAKFASITPDVFALPNFLAIHDTARFFKYFIASRQVDIMIISNSLVGYAALPLLRMWFPNLVTVDYNHMQELDWNSGGWPRYSTASTGFLDGHIVASKHLKEYMVQLLADPAKISTCYINVDINLMMKSEIGRNEKRSELEIDSNTIVLLFAARLEPQKNPLILFDVMKELQKSSATKYLLLIVGDGSLKGLIQEQLVSRSLRSSIRMMGEQSFEDMKKLYEATDILLLPSTWEGIASVVYEAMSMEVPAIATDVGGQNELITHGVDGILVPGNITNRELVYHIVRAIYQLEDKDTRIMMGKMARQKVVENFQLENLGPCMIKAFEQAEKNHWKVHKEGRNLIGSEEIAQEMFVRTIALQIADVKLMSCDEQ